MSTEQTFKIHLKRRARGAVVLCDGARPVPPPVPRVPSRIARLMALAIKIEGKVRDGEFTDYAEVALSAGLTRARISQIANLTLLAPEIQEQILFMERPEQGRDGINEHTLREVTIHMDWSRQRDVFEELLRKVSTR